MTPSHIFITSVMLLTLGVLAWTFLKNITNIWYALKGDNLHLQSSFLISNKYDKAHKIFCSFFRWLKFSVSYEVVTKSLPCHVISELAPWSFLWFVLLNDEFILLPGNFGGWHRPWALELFQILLRYRNWAYTSTSSPHCKTKYKLCV
jgi:hypothetical protein